MRARGSYILLLTLALLLVALVVPAIATAGGVLVYNGDGQVTEMEPWGTFNDFGTAAGKTVTYSSLLPADLTPYDIVIVPGFFEMPVGFSQATKDGLAAYVQNGGRLLALAEGGIVYQNTNDAMNDLSAAIVGAGGPTVVVANLACPGDETMVCLTSGSDTSPLTTASASTQEVNTVGAHASSKISGGGETLLTDIGGNSVMKAQKVGNGWFFLCGDSNMFNETLKWAEPLGFYNVYTNYDNGKLAANISNWVDPDAGASEPKVTTVKTPADLASTLSYDFNKWVAAGEIVGVGTTARKATTALNDFKASLTRRVSLVNQGSFSTAASRLQTLYTYCDGKSRPAVDKVKGSALSSLQAEILALIAALK